MGRLTVLSFGGLEVTASDVLLGRRPLFGGRGGEGLDKAVPLVITWESSAENKNHRSHNGEQGIFQITFTSVEKAQQCTQILGLNILCCFLLEYHTRNIQVARL